jgi:hypothetical protein
MTSSGKAGVIVPIPRERQSIPRNGVLGDITCPSGQRTKREVFPIERQLEEGRDWPLRPGLQPDHRLRLTHELVLASLHSPKALLSPSSHVQASKTWTPSVPATHFAR